MIMANDMQAAIAKTVIDHGSFLHNVRGDDLFAYQMELERAAMLLQEAHHAAGQEARRAGNKRLPSVMIFHKEVSHYLNDFRPYTLDMNAARPAKQKGDGS